MLLKEYLNGLKLEQKLSWKDISELSGMPEDTVRSIFYGNTTDPRFSTVSRLVYALGGRLDDIAGISDNTNNEANTSLVKIYEQRIQDKNMQIKILRREKRTYLIAAGVLVLFIIFMLVVDILVGSRGWILYK